MAFEREASRISPASRAAAQLVKERARPTSTSGPEAVRSGGIVRHRGYAQLADRWCCRTCPPLVIRTLGDETMLCFCAMQDVENARVATGSCALPLFPRTFRPAQRLSAARAAADVLLVPAPCGHAHDSPTDSTRYRAYTPPTPSRFPLRMKAVSLIRREQGRAAHPRLPGDAFAPAPVSTSRVECCRSIARGCVVLEVEELSRYSAVPSPCQVHPAGLFRSRCNARSPPSEKIRSRLTRAAASRLGFYPRYLLYKVAFPA